MLPRHILDVNRITSLEIPDFVSSVRLITMPNKTGETIQYCLNPVVTLKVSVFSCSLFVEHTLRIHVDIFEIYLIILMILEICPRCGVYIHKTWGTNFKCL